MDHVEKTRAQLQQENDNLRQQLGEARELIRAMQEGEVDKLLFQSSRRWQALMDALPVGVSYSDDVTCQRISGNPAVLAQFEMGPNDNLSASAADASAPGRQVRFFRDGRPIAAAELPLQRAVVENRQIPPTELEIHLPSGRRWFASVSGAPVRDEAGKVVGGVNVVADITAAKHMNERLLQSAAELQAVNAELRQSRRAAINLMDDALAAHAQAQRTAEALREGEARLRTLGDQIPGGAIYQYVRRPDGRTEYAYISAGIVRIFGCSAEGVMVDSDAFRQLIVEEDRPRLAAAEEQSARELTPFDCEFRQRTVAGQVKWVQCRAMPRRLADGAVMWDGIVVDVTPRKHREERIAKLTRLYEVLSRANEAIVRARDAKSLCGEVCQIVATVAGFPLAWIGDVENRQVVPVAWAGRAADYLQEIHIAIDGTWGAGPGGTAVRENRTVVNDSFVENPRTVPWRDAAVRFGFAASACFPLRREGKPIGELTLYSPEAGAFDAEQVALLESLAADVSFALDALAHDQLRLRAEDRSRLLAEVTARLLASDQPQQVVDSVCRQVMEHLNCQAFFNFLVDDKTGQLRLNACGGIPQDVVQQIQSLEYGAAVCGCVARDGRRILAERIQTTSDPRTDMVRGLGMQAYACYPLLNQGRVIGTLSFGSRSKTAFAEDELSLMEAVTDHVAIAMQRVCLLESLQEHARAAEAANRAKTQFLANMSHELRTPMNAILGMIDLALPKAAHPLVRDCLETAKGSADLLLALLNDLLDSAKIESGKLELEAAPFSLRGILDQLTRVLAVRASERGLTLYSRIDEAAPDAVIGDRMRLQQILLNLAGNAIKFTENGEVEISVRAIEGGERTDGGMKDGAMMDGKAAAVSETSLIPHPSSLIPPSSVTLEFAVRDTGIGISTADQTLLFRPFAQADASMTRRFGGTGLGLSICKSLVDMMGGRIWMESTMNAGSTFYFTVRLPLAAELPAEAGPLLPPRSPAVTPLRILLVEDNPANQKLIHYVLRERGHHVEFAGEGEEAVYLAAENRYDVILMDVQMPGMDGLAATAAIRRQEAEAAGRVPIIAMTAHAMPGDRDRCLAAGMDGYLSKPVNFRRMIELIETLAGGTAAAAEDQPAATAATEATPPAANAVFNRQLALSRCFDNEDMLRDMVQCFFQDVEKLLPQMRAALALGDLEEVGQLGHRMKGTLVYLGAEAARPAASRLERFSFSTEGAPAEAAEAVDSLDRECFALKAVLERYLSAAAPGATEKAD
jgi:PAS domain S-box-containing protein